MKKKYLFRLNFYCAKIRVMKDKKLHLAGCVILNEKGEVLLLHRNTEVRKQRETPGGKLENGENAQKAEEREI